VNKSTTNILIFAAIAAAAYYAYSTGMLGTSSISANATVILQSSPGNYTGTTTYSQLPGAPALGAVFSYGGLSYQLSTGANGQLFATVVSS
jgi:peroxiredoxin